MRTWRERARPIIANGIRSVVGAKMPPYSEAQKQAIRKVLIPLYPWGQRSNHPYKIWLDEIRKQVCDSKYREWDHNQIPLFKLEKKDSK